MIELADTTARISREQGAFLHTRRVYDALAPVYALPTLLFHSKAHSAALAASSVENGTRVLEVAIGSGEMLRRLVEANPDGQTVGVDLSPKMAARSQERAGRLFPGAAVQCQAADVRQLPFETGHFDDVVCCYLFELIPQKDLNQSLTELRRVLRVRGRLTVILIAQNNAVFNAMYRFCASLAPAFWGRQLDGYITALLPGLGFAIESDTHVQQLFYSSRIVTARNIGKSDLPTGVFDHENGLVA